MRDNIANYQKAFNIVINKLKEKKDIVAVLVFGSMVTGDLWEGSDIDFFAVIEGEFNYIRNVYTEENGIAVHIKIISKDKFIKISSNNSMGGFLYRMIVSSKMIFCKDKEITKSFDKRRYHPDLDKQKWDLVYFSALIKNIDLCKKYMFNSVFRTAYCEAVLCMEKYSKLYVNHLGYTISKDTLGVCMNLNDSFKIITDDFFNNKMRLEEKSKMIIDYLEEDIMKNIKEYTATLLNYMISKDSFLSAEDIMSDDIFKGYNIHCEHLLNKLWELDIIKKDKRDCSFENTKIIEENIYFL
ncbi:nucleotidyltransferase domain-containing protein [Clostridium sp. DL1XJH146]